MTEPARTDPHSLADETMLRRSDDLLADFDRAFQMFQEFVRARAAGCRSAATSFCRTGGSRIPISIARCFPIVAMGRDYWPGMLDFIAETIFREGAAEAGEVGGFLVTDSVSEAVEHIEGTVRGNS